MSRMIHQDKGSKRRVRRVRLSHGEIVTAVLLFLVLATEAIIVTLWLMGHALD